MKTLALLVSIAALAALAAFSAQAQTPPSADDLVHQNVRCLDHARPVVVFKPKEHRAVAQSPFEDDWKDCETVRQALRFPPADRAGQAALAAAMDRLKSKK